MDYGTTSYTQETPAFLWPHFKSGPAAEYDRLHNRISELIALDVLTHAADQLDEQERARAEELAANLPFDLPDLDADQEATEDAPDEQAAIDAEPAPEPAEEDATPGVRTERSGLQHGGER